MCISFKLNFQPEEVKEIFEDIDLYQFTTPLQKIVFPTEEIPIITDNGIKKMSWGIKLNFSPKKMINTRSETFKLKFPNLSNKRGCIPIISFFEWVKIKGSKRLIEIFPQNHATNYLATIYDDIQNSFSILTTASPPSFFHMHLRIPCIITKENIKSYLKGNYNQNMNINSFYI